MTKKYQDWWSKVTIGDLRANIVLLQWSAGHDLSNTRRAREAIVQMMDLILRTRITMMSRLVNPLIHLLPAEERALSKMMTMTKIQKLTLNVEGTKNARSSLQIPPKWLLEIVF